MKELNQWMKKWRNIIILGIACFILTLAIFIQINSIQEMTIEIGPSSLRGTQELIDEYLRWRGRYNGAFAELQRTEERLAGVRSQALSRSEEDLGSELELQETNKILGLTDIRGRGITIIVDDNRDLATADAPNVSALLIHQDDILNILNELFNAGADAVSVNQQRVVATTAILCDGNVIRINNQRIGVPILIRAIGFTESLYYALNRPGGYLDIMRNDGIRVLVQKEDSVRISRYSGIRTHEYIR